MDYFNVVKETQDWISEFVIKLNICPFASPSFINGEIKYQVVDNTSDDFYQHFLRLILDLNKDNLFSNAFLILTEAIEFHEYLKLYHSSESLLKEAGADEQFQLASFHPAYLYDGLSFEDVANFRNRSPYPMIHILRVDEVENAILQHKDTLQIPVINSQKLRDLGEYEIKQLLNKIRR